jgi:hypothetical protein
MYLKFKFNKAYSVFINCSSPKGRRNVFKGDLLSITKDVYIDWAKRPLVTSYVDSVLLPLTGKNVPEIYCFSHHSNFKLVVWCYCLVDEYLLDFVSNT